MSSRKSNRKEAKKNKAGHQPTGDALLHNKNLWTSAAAISMLTVLIYLPGLHNWFVNLDDDRYIQMQPLIRQFDFKALFSENIMGNYHPFTMTMYAIIYHFFQANPAAYHGFSLLFHVINACLLLFLMYRLTGSLPVSFMVSLLFGVHPMQVESVAWASELKNVMYATGFILSLICYLEYVKQRRPGFYVLSLVLFLASLLCKSAAVSFAVILPLVDFYSGRKFTAKVMLEKAPFFALALIFGIIAIHYQQTYDAVQSFNLYTLPQRLAFASSGFLGYIIKIFLPLNFSPFYAYPEVTGSEIPPVNLTCLIGVIILSAAVIYSLKGTKNVFFGFGFFAIAVFPALQLFPVGGAMMADRYNYVSCIGIFFTVVTGALYLWKRINISSPVATRVAMLVPALYVLFCCYQVHHQAAVWQNSDTLWTKVIENYPRLGRAYTDRGQYYIQTGELDKARNDFDEGIKLEPGNPSPFAYRGLVFGMQGRSDEAIKDLTHAINTYSKNPVSPLERAEIAKYYYNRALVYVRLNKANEACTDFKQAAGYGDQQAMNAFKDVCR